MIGEVSLYGLYVPPLLLLTLAALGLLNQVLARLGAYRFVWHPALFDFALFVLVLGGLSTLFLALELSMAFNNPLPALGRMGITLLATAAATWCGWQLWRQYEVEPWTRDGRVKAYVVQVAPDVTGLVTKVWVHDNQEVKAGQPLFEIDRARFELALRQADTAVVAAHAVLAQAQRENQRNGQLDDLVAQETREQGETRLDQARATLAQAEVTRDTARLNLSRTRVVSVVDGVVTNLDLRVGAYASASKPVMAVVDSGSFYVEGYFEETKLQAIHPGDPVQVSLMGSRQAIAGHVESFAEGITDRDRSTGQNLLPNVNPTFNWVRLAQRIPVRVALDSVPPELRLVAGQTATVQVLRAPAKAGTRQGIANTTGKAS